jgi:hypothetical protein
VAFIAGLDATQKPIQAKRRRDLSRRRRQKGKEEARSSFLKKEPKNFYPFAAQAHQRLCALG